MMPRKKVQEKLRHNPDKRPEKLRHNWANQNFPNKIFPALKFPPRCTHREMLHHMPRPGDTKLNQAVRHSPSTAPPPKRLFFFEKREGGGSKPGHGVQVLRTPIPLENTVKRVPDHQVSHISSAMQVQALFCLWCPLCAPHAGSSQGCVPALRVCGRWSPNGGVGGESRGE